MTTTPAQHAAVIADALAAVVRHRTKPGPARNALEHITDLLDIAVLAFVDSEQFADPASTAATDVPVDAALALQDAETLASDNPQTGLPRGFTAVVLAPVTGRAPELPAPVDPALAQLAQQQTTLCSRLALVEEWLLDTEHPEATADYVATSLTLRTRLAHLATAVDNRRPASQR
ncbi:hypothetical protein ACF1A9_19675 [Streptomyces sp. NPDC014872]|uniref:hypothetical protein n=1 Tax=Streptomyces sp. NPDC014872 TaxID=3364926 RepID=UPI0037020041